MPSLLNTTVSANYLKTSPSSQYGTRALTFLNVTLSGAGKPDLTKQTGSTGAYSDAGSYLFSVVRAVQLVSEIYVVGTPTATDVTIAVASNTANDSDVDSNVSNGGWGDLEAAILAGLGSPANTTVAVVAKQLSGATLA